ncbi:MAG: hypothetical protein ACT4OP_11615 [Actinomycetota bacterium]
MEMLATFLRSSWSVASLSAAERSVDGKRIKEFDADELVALSVVFEVPLAYWFQNDGEKVIVGDSQELSQEDLLGLVFGPNDAWQTPALSLLRSSAEDLGSARRLLNLVGRIVAEFANPSLSGIGGRTPTKQNRQEPIDTHQQKEAHGEQKGIDSEEVQCLRRHSHRQGLP